MASIAIQAHEVVGNCLVIETMTRILDPRLFYEKQGYDIAPPSEALKQTMTKALQLFGEKLTLLEQYRSNPSAIEASTNLAEDKKKKYAAKLAAQPSLLRDGILSVLEELLGSAKGQLCLFTPDEFSGTVLDVLAIQLSILLKVPVTSFRLVKSHKEFQALQPLIVVGTAPLPDTPSTFVKVTPYSKYIDYDFVKDAFVLTINKLNLHTDTEYLAYVAPLCKLIVGSGGAQASLLQDAIKVDRTNYRALLDSGKQAGFVNNSKEILSAIKTALPSTVAAQSRIRARLAKAKEAASALAAVPTNLALLQRQKEIFKKKAIQTYPRPANMTEADYEAVLNQLAEANPNLGTAQTTNYDPLTPNYKEAERPSQDWKDSIAVLQMLFDKVLFQKFPPYIYPESLRSYTNRLETLLAKKAPFYTYAFPDWYDRVIERFGSPSTYYNYDIPWEIYLGHLKHLSETGDHTFPPGPALQTLEEDRDHMKNELLEVKGIYLPYQYDRSLADYETLLLTTWAKELGIYFKKFNFKPPRTHNPRFQTARLERLKEGESMAQWIHRHKKRFGVAAATLTGQQTEIPILHSVEEALDYAREVGPKDRATSTGSWSQTLEAIQLTLDYVQNKLHHSCYMLCVKERRPYLFKLESTEPAPLFAEVLEAEKQEKGIKDFDVSKMRVMQCIVKPQKDTSTTAKEWLPFLQGIPNLPNGVFLLNLTDAVLLKKDFSEPWDFFRGETVFLPPVFHDRAYMPILSYSGHTDFQDIVIPNYDDIFEIKRNADGSVNEASTLGFELNMKTLPERRVMAVFRGSSTGCGTTPQTNQRLKLTSADFLKTLPNPTSLDVGITTVTKQWKMDPVVGLSRVDASKIKLAKPLTLKEQAGNYMIIHVDGNVHAYRLLKTMLTGSVILRVMSPYKGWMDSQLIGFEVGKDEWNIDTSIAHYLIIKPDLSNLQQSIEWVWKNQPPAVDIGMFARDFALKALHLKTIQDSFVAALEQKAYPTIPPFTLTGGRRRRRQRLTKRRRRGAVRKTRKHH